MKIDRNHPQKPGYVFERNEFAYAKDSAGQSIEIARYKNSFVLTDSSGKFVVLPPFKVSPKSLTGIIWNSVNLNDAETRIRSYCKNIIKDNLKHVGEKENFFIIERKTTFQFVSKVIGRELLMAKENLSLNELLDAIPGSCGYATDAVKAINDYQNKKEHNALSKSAKSSLSPAHTHSSFDQLDFEK